MSKKSSDILRQTNIWQNYFEEVLASDYEKSKGQTTQTFIIDKNNINNRPLLHSETLNEYYQYYGYEVCPNHKHHKNSSCHLVQLPICHTTPHGFVVVNTIHGIRLKHSDIVSKKTPRHKGQQKNSTQLLTNITTNCSKHTNGTVEHSRSGKLFMILPNQSTTEKNCEKNSEKNSYKNNERNWPHIVNSKSLQITESIKSLRKKSNERKSSINESLKNSNCFEKVKSIKTSKITDRDVIFGNARLVLRKHNYGWEKSRLEWLLELERKNAA